MRLNFGVLAASVVALAAPIFAAVTPEQIVKNINELTTKSEALQFPAESITPVNGPLLVIGHGPFPRIISGFHEIVTIAMADIQAMQDMTPIPAGPGADAIFDAFRDFVRVNQELLNILIRKADLFNTVPFIGHPVATVLRSVENVVDTIAVRLINTVQSQAANLQDHAGSLDMTLQTAIQSYEGLARKKREVQFKA